MQLLLRTMRRAVDVESIEFVDQDALTDRLRVG
jgi:hypothetical protein